MIKYIYFDVAGTILYKPSLYTNIQEVLNNFGYVVSLKDLKNKHKYLSEKIAFPDRTDVSFYQNFNAELLSQFNIYPRQEMLDAIFKKCTYLPWEKFNDTKILSEIGLPIGVISNFNSTLKVKLRDVFGDVFKDVLVSEELGIAKPDIEFYKKALERISFSANEVLYIGDSIKLDYEPASKIGMNVLIIDRDGFYPKADYIINDLQEINNFLL